MSTQTKAEHQNQKLRQYYQWHSRIYDATRWSFLFGRKTIAHKLAAQFKPDSILEVGCGTGNNLVQLASRFPQAQITGVDVSADMLRIARHKFADNKRVTLLNQPYPSARSARKKYDLVLFSYALTMFNPGWEAAIEAAVDDLTAGGVLAVVDFHLTPLKFFQRWMRINHVHMDGHLLPFLLKHTLEAEFEVRSAYGGLWQYVIFIGRKHSA